MKNLRSIFLGAALSGPFAFLPTQAQKPKVWEAPASADDSKNPCKNDANAVLEGKKIYTSMCAVCHGETGRGNGAASVALEPHPANFLTINIRNESDGAIFWKLTEGRPPMASYKTLLTETQRWKLVTYIRKLEEKK
jgi:mono/diheme cytochrome c family protein